METKNETFDLENKDSPKSEVISSICYGNKLDMGFNDGITDGVAPSNLNTTLMLEDIAVGLDDGDRKIAGETVACKLWQGCVLVNSRFWGVGKDQSSYLGEKEEIVDSTFDDNWSQVCGSLVVIMPSTKQCMNEE